MPKGYSDAMITYFKDKGRKKAPWTRDARVRADVVGIAPDVSGLVSEVLVRDNAAVKRATPCSGWTASASPSP